MSSNTNSSIALTRFLSGICYLLLATICVGCKDPIPREANSKFGKISATVKKRLDDIMPKRGLILASFRTQCQLQTNPEFPIVGKILVNYRGDNSPIDKSNQLRLRYEYRDKDKTWIYRDLKVVREIVGEDLDDEDTMFEAILRIQPTKKKDQEPFL